MIISCCESYVTCSDEKSSWKETIETTNTSDQARSAAEEEKNGKKKSFTTARQVLAVHYLLKSMGISPVDAPVPVAEFVQFLTGREVNARRIQDSTLYKNVANPFKLNDAALKKDLEFILPFFRKMNLDIIVKTIEKEIADCEGRT